ncbi:hypothetical protein [Sorangium sp. So ce693]|uniref:hypothetical protein n=1 Tax=Sorangium sp. So ce693 TaxID=3133318 RepID=UPI003F6365B6
MAPVDRDARATRAAAVAAARAARAARAAQRRTAPGAPHCIINDCGKAKCPTCPDFVNDLLQNIVIRSWCSYVCVKTGTSPPEVVAVGAGAISALGNIYFGPVCMPYP